MDDGDRTLKLLEEIRDTQREHLAEYRRVTRQLLDLQEGAVARQAQFGGRLYRRFIVPGAVMVVVLLILLVYLLVLWGPYLMRR